jgi:hypothetical protein
MILSCGPFTNYSLVFKNIPKTYNYYSITIQLSFFPHIGEQLTSFKSFTEVKFDGILFTIAIVYFGKLYNNSGAQLLCADALYWSRCNRLKSTEISCGVRSISLSEIYWSLPSWCDDMYRGCTSGSTQLLVLYISGHWKLKNLLNKRRSRNSPQSLAEKL